MCEFENRIGPRRATDLVPWTGFGPGLTFCWSDQRSSHPLGCLQGANGLLGLLSVFLIRKMLGPPRTITLKLGQGDEISAEQLSQVASRLREFATTMVENVDAHQTRVQSAAIPVYKWICVHQHSIVGFPWHRL